MSAGRSDVCAAWHHGRMEVSEHIDALTQHGTLLADVASQTPLDASVPSCPGWQLRDLLRHTGDVHRWAARFVAEQLPGPVPRLTQAQQLAGGPPDAELTGWFRDGHAALVATLRSADPGVCAWAFLPAPSPLAFWARRQAHETTIHRIDAELAAGRAVRVGTRSAAEGTEAELAARRAVRVRMRSAADGTDGELAAGRAVRVRTRSAAEGTDGELAAGRAVRVGTPSTADGIDAELAAASTATVDAAFAADGIDELILGFFGRDAEALTVQQRASSSRSLLVRATDTGQSWGVTLTADGGQVAAVCRGGGGAADCVVEGEAAALYLLLWNRAAPADAGVAVSGAAEVLAAWRAGLRVVWGG